MKFRSFLRYLDLRWFRGVKLRPRLPIHNYRSALRVEALEERTLLSAFYSLTPIASTAGGTYKSFGNLPSINDQGQVAFVTNGGSGNGIYLSAAGQLPTNVTAQFTANNDSRTYGRGVAINDQNQIVATEQINGLFDVHLWDGNNPNQHTLLLQTPTPVSDSPGEEFDSVQTFDSINNQNETAFVAFDASQAARYVLKDTSPSSVGTGPSTLLTTDANGAKVSPRPVLTDDGQVLYVTLNGNMYLAQAATNRQFIAGAKNGFLSIDPGAGVSKDGRVIVFTGNRGSGVGLFAAYQSDSSWQILRLAGEGLDSFTSFDATGDVVVNNTWSTDRKVTIAFKGTSALGTGIYSVQLSVFGQQATDPNPVTAASVYASGVKPVALQDTDTLSGVTIANVELGQGISDIHDGEIAFWAQTSDGNQEIVRADPQQVVWVNFYPSDTPPVGATKANLNLLQEVNITALGWKGSMAGALRSQFVTLPSITIQNAVVTEVQTLYTNAGAHVVVLGRAIDAPPAYVPEPIPHSSQLAGVYQTIYVGEGPPVGVGGSPYLGMASQPLAAAGALDYYAQIPDSTAVVFVNNILTDGAYGGTSPAALSQNQIVNGLASVIAHESGHNFGLFHLSPLDSNQNFLTKEIMVNGSLAGSFDAQPEFSPTAYPVFPYTTALENVTESDAQRLDFSTDAPAPSGTPPNQKLLGYVDEGTARANIGFQAANTLTVQHLFVGLQSTVVEAMPIFQDLGGGDLSTLLNNANIAADSLDTMIVLGSSTGAGIDIVGIAQGQEGAQNSLSMSVLGLTTDSRLQAPVTGPGAAFHFYKLTSTGAVDLGLASIETTPVNHAPILATINNAVTQPGVVVTFTASGSDPDAGQTLNYSLDPGAPMGASIDATTGAFTWTPTAAQAAQVYNFSVRVTDNGTPTRSVSQPVTIDVENPLQVVALTELTTPNPGPMQFAVDFNETLQPTPAQTVGNYKIVSQGGISLPIQSAVYSDNGTQHRVVLTVAAGTTVAPDVFDVSIDGANLTATNGDHAAPNVSKLWVSVSGTNTLEAVAAQPDGSLAPTGESFSLGYWPAQQVVAADFTGDGVTDLVVLPEYEPDPLLLLAGKGDGTFEAPQPIGLGGFDTKTIWTVDWNNDGKPDLVAAVVQGNSSYYYVLLNDGLGHFSNAPDTPIPVVAIGATVIADVTGDGLPEIIHEPNGAGAGLALEIIGKDPFVGYGPIMESPLDFTISNFLGGSKLADLNEDGKPDFVAITYALGDHVVVILSTPTGWTRGNIVLDMGNTDDPGATAHLGAIVADFDDDGHADIAILGAPLGLDTGDTVYLLKGDGHGNFTALPTVEFNRRDVTGMVTADFNHDGRTDMFWLLAAGPSDFNGSTFDNVDRLSGWTFLNNGHGGFDPSTPKPVPLGAAGSTIELGNPTVAELDGDGFPDVILGTNDQWEIAQVLNDGAGTMHSAPAPSTFIGAPIGQNGKDNSTYQSFADFNNDGLTDFVISEGNVEIYLGQSGGAFDHIQSLPATGGYRPGAVGDLNHDGIPDLLLITDAGIYDMLVFLGNGDGTFRTAPSFRLSWGNGAVGVASVSLGDVNNDGNLDAVVALSSGQIAVCFGDGTGKLFYNANTLFPGLFAPALADFDHDGKLDLVVTSYQSGGADYELRVYFGRGNGLFTAGPVITTVVSGGTPDEGFLVGDFNGDGNLDFFGYRGLLLGLKYYQGDGHGGFSPVSTLDLPGGTHPAAGDFNGDGKLDVAEGFGFDDKTTAVYLGDGTGHFAAAVLSNLGASFNGLATVPRDAPLVAGSIAITDHAPAATDDHTTAVSGSVVSVPVLANDTDADQDPLTISQLTAPSHGTVHINNNGTPNDPTDDTILYAPTAGFFGTDTFTYSIADPAGVEATATVTVTVNTADGSISATSGSGQVARENAAFSAPLVVIVKDVHGNPEAGIVVTFAAPTSGASVVFSSGNSATTNAQGQASLNVTANGSIGSYTVTAASPGFIGPAGFTLTNIPGASAAIAATSGGGQSVLVNTAFATALTTTVTDANGNPTPNVTVTFAAPGSGASVTFTGGATATTNAQGVASKSVTANATIGSYTITASVSGVNTPANFALTNTAGAPANVAATSGGGQSVLVSTAFANPLVATVTDANGNPVPNVIVTFAAPGNGASVTFTGSNTATTNTQGQASKTVTANGTAGFYTVTVSVSGVTTPANFALSNTLTTPTTVTATSGGGQSSVVNIAFANPLVVTVTDASGDPVANVTVTFAAPSNGASVTFTGGATAITNTQGVASKSVTANATIGSYTIMASISGVSTPANFALTNTAGAPATVAATSGAASAPINTAFTSPLVATVTDAAGNPLQGVTVTFAAPGTGASVTFLGGTTATTDAQGQASNSVIATATAGAFTVTATVAGVATPANFALTNTGTTTAPAISSATATTFTVGTAGTFTVTATGSPAPTLGESGVLPTGVTFNATGVLSGTPAAGTAGSFPITFIASNGVNPNATQNFTLTVNATGAAPAITSAAATTFVLGTAGTFTVTATGSPTPTLSESGTLPTGVTFNTATGVLSGTPTGSAGSFPLTFTASNAVNPNVTQNFTLTVNPTTATPAAITKLTSTTANGTYDAGTALQLNQAAPTINLTITFSAPVTLAGGNLTVTLSNGATVTITPFTNSTTATGTYTVAQTDKNAIPLDTTSLTLTVGATLKDASGNTVPLTFTAAQSLKATSTFNVKNFNFQELGAYRPTDGSWSLDSDGTTGFGPDDQVFFKFTTPGSTVVGVVGDWTGTGRFNIGDFNTATGVWDLDLNGNGKLDPGETFTFGQAGDKPVVGDWTGDGISKLGVFRGTGDAANSGEFILDTNNNRMIDSSDKTFVFGLATDNIIVGDWTGTGKAKVGVYRDAKNFNPTDAGDIVFSENTSDTDPTVFTNFVFGLITDKVVIGDWNGSGTAKVAVYRDGSSVTDTTNPLDAPGTALFSEDYSGALDFSKDGKIFLFGLSSDQFVAGNWVVTPPLQANGLAQFAAGGAGPGNVAALTKAELQPVLQQALVNWEAVGANVSALQNVNVQLGALDDNLIGWTSGNAITLDPTADGWGWNTDPSSADFTTTGATGFEATPGSAAVGQMDLLTVVEHELGHELGLRDVDWLSHPSDLMAATLAPGVRRQPTTQELDALFASLGGPHS